MIHEKLDRFLNNETRFDDRRYGLRDISALLEHFGNPHRSVPAYHIAGTNGKGSVAHMLNAISINAGYKTGLYTSPHLLDINERITLQNITIDYALLERYIDEIIECVETEGSICPTYFDVLTVCAFRYFSDSGADCAIIETGLGGRLDSTNVITPICSIITDISFDHAGILGSTLGAISGEKAGIIKDGVPVVTSNINPEVLGPIITTAHSLNAPLYMISKDFAAHNIIETDSGFVFDYILSSGQASKIKGIELFSLLEHQVLNASCAITASVVSRHRFPQLTENAIITGIADFSAPGRLETLYDNPLIIFDPAHNEAALGQMVRLMKRRFHDREVTIILSLMKDKDVKSIMHMFASLGMKAIYFVLDDQRCYFPPHGAYADVIIKIINADDSLLAAELDALASGRSLFFFTGSFRLYRTAIDYAEHVSIKCS